ncbi:hypothetical protein BBF96_13595 [Anoxybacter fermentans]|uniref:Major facilitator superfamily (MFS) profile domain-containing protein n=1 Tax=Anoxybacter fermentans TaxID=1323375 RepID=A0A3S9T323_9FIRM|nr:hypothetical protein BBF96_13595 [Anoxybacter fermentans]
MKKYYYIIVFFQLFITEITGTTFVLYLLYKGLNLFHVNIVVTVFFATILIMEIPTGIIADLYGRRISVSLGFLCFSISGIIFLKSNSFSGFIVAEILAAIGATLQSGALEAWVVDNLKFFNKENIKLELLFSRAGMIRYFAGFFCGLLGAYLANFKYELPWIVSIILCLLITFFTLAIMKEPYFKKKSVNFKNTLSSMKIIIKDSINYGMMNKPILIFFIIEILISFSNSAGNTFQQPRLVSLSGHGIWIFGWIKGIYSIFLMSGSWLIGYLSKKHKDHYQLIFYSCFMTGFWLILSGVFNSFASVLTVFLIYEIGRGMYNPAKQTFLNYRIPSDKRATILSFQSAVSQMGMILGLFITGIISSNFIDLSSNQLPIRISWILCGIIAIIAAPISIIIKNIETKKVIKNIYCVE